MQQSANTVEQELGRIKEEYTRRASCLAYNQRYSLFNEAALLQVQGLERALLMLLKRHQCSDLTHKKILDIGCGSGLLLHRFIAYGAQPANLYGLDLMPERIEQAGRLNPAINWHTGSAHHMAYPDASFDLITLSTVFSSILSRSTRWQITEEVWRVLKPGGLILCYDFAYSNPRNPNVKGIPPRQLQRLFQRPDMHFDVRRITLAPPISRVIAPRGRWLAALLESLKVFNTHYICVIRQYENQAGKYSEGCNE